MTYRLNIVGKLWTTAAMAIAGVGLLVLAGTGSALANGSGAGIVSSPHDFTDGAFSSEDPVGNPQDESWNWRNEICRVCHAPHDKNRDTATAVFDTGTGLLWNHAVNTTTTYTLYTSNTLDGAIGQPDGIAKLCLGCHDGTVGINQFDSRVGDPATVTMDEVDEHFRVPNIPGAEGSDLRATHPISIVYNMADTGLNPTSDTFTFGMSIASVLDNNKVQCSSCHDVHDGVSEAVPATHLLREANTVAAGGTASGLCLTCHNK